MSGVHTLTRAITLAQHDILQFFAYEHLKPELHAISKPFGDLARFMTETLVPCAELSAGLRKLLEAKDCAVRAYLFKPER